VRILVAVDGSEQSDAAVDAVGRRCVGEDIEVRALSVVEPPNFPDTYPGGGGNINVDGAIEDAARERARAAVEKAAERLGMRDGKRSLNVTTEVVSGSPKRLILERAEAFGADLIVLGSHGYGMFDRFLLGSVSQAIALHARCSVEIVRRRKLSTTGGQ